MMASRLSKDTKVFSILKVVKNPWWVKSPLSLSLSENYHEVAFDIHALMLCIGRQILRSGSQVMAGSSFAIHGNSTLQLAP